MIELRGVSKDFPGVRSLDQVDFRVNAGEVRALVGENGAGKSTLIKIIAGVYSPDSGQLRFDSRDVVWRNPHEAWNAGIQVIFQELTLFQNLTVAENILLGQEPRTRIGRIDFPAMAKVALAALDRLGVRIDPFREVGGLSVAQQQMIELARALVRRVRLLILDEPTAVIAGVEVIKLLSLVRALRDDGVAIIFISHRLDEVFAIADSVTVLKDGRLVATRPTDAFDRNTLVSMMVGRNLPDIFPPKPPRKTKRPPVLRVEHLADDKRVHGVSLEVAEGEVLGVAGLVGSGRTELAHLIFGSAPQSRGRVWLDERELRYRRPAESIAAGVGFLTEDRKGEGLFLQMDVAANISAPRLNAISAYGFLRRTAEYGSVARTIEEFGIASPSQHAPVAGLSGGNQQRVLIGRWVRACRRLLLLDEPTRGVDIGAKVEIYRLIRGVAAEGIAIVVISSELSEIIGLCDRGIVMREGRVTGELHSEELSEEALMNLATGGAQI